MSHPSHSVTGDPRYSSLPWTPAEAAILVQRRDGDKWTYRAIAEELAPRSDMACRQHYKRLSGRDLTACELASLGRLWMA